MEAAAEKCAVELVVACPVLTLTHAVVYLRSAKNRDPEVSGPSACGMNDAYRRMIPVFWAVFIMRL